MNCGAFWIKVAEKNKTSRNYTLRLRYGQDSLKNIKNRFTERIFVWETGQKKFKTDN